MEWGWDTLESTTDVNISKDTLEVVIHPHASRGTGAVRGDMPFVPGHIYYWEIKVDGSPTATDMVTLQQLYCFVFLSETFLNIYIQNV